jgi:hypothetical protein
MTNEFDGYREKQYSILADTINEFRIKLNKVAHSVGSLSDLNPEFVNDSDVVDALNNLFSQDSDLQKQIDDLKLADSDLLQLINNIDAGGGTGADSDWVLQQDSDIYATISNLKLKDLFDVDDYTGNVTVGDIIRWDGNSWYTTELNDSDTLDDVNQRGNVTTREIILPKIKINKSGVNSGIELNDSDNPNNGKLNVFLDSDDSNVIINTDGIDEIKTKGEGDSDLNRLLTNSPIGLDGGYYTKGSQINSGVTKTPGLVIGNNANITLDRYQKIEYTPSFLTQWSNDFGGTFYTGHPGTYLKQDGLVIVTGHVVNGSFNITFDTTGFDGTAALGSGTIYIDCIDSNFKPISQDGLITHIDPTSRFIVGNEQLYLTAVEEGEDSPGFNTPPKYCLKLIRSDGSSVSFGDPEIVNGVGDLSFSYSYISDTINLQDPVFRLSSNAGEDRTVYEGRQVILDGSESKTITEFDTYLWEQLSGELVTLSDINAVQPTFTAPLLDSSGEDKILDFRLTLSYNNGEIVDSDRVKIIVSSAQLGTIIMWSDTIDTIPDGWVICDGNNGTPDLRDRFIVGAGSNYSVGDIGGANEVTLSVNQIPPHTHEVPDGTTGGGSGAQNGPLTGDTLSSQSTGGGQPHENRPPYYALAYIMRVG